MYTVAIVTSSDKGSKGEREDKSGAVIREIVEKSGFQVKRYVVLPDEKELLKVIKAELKEITDKRRLG